MSELPEDPSVSPDVLAQLVEQVLSARAAGATIDLIDLCGSDSGMLTALQQALQQIERLPGMFQGAHAPDPAIGTVLAGRFLIEQWIGSGAMGVVYRATDQDLGRDVAVKLLRPELPAGERMAKRLSREAEVLADIRSRNVVTVFDRGETNDGRVFVVMELLDGLSLASYLYPDQEVSGSPMPASSAQRAAQLAQFLKQLGVPTRSPRSDLRQIVHWMVDACDGLQAAHEAGVVHRDVKPSNLFLERSGRVVVLDFGIGSSSATATLGGAGSPVGTPAYMAPEQLTDVALDARADVYGLAATLYHLISGRPPFVGSIANVLQGVSRAEPISLDRLRPALPADLVAIVEKGMARDRTVRYQSIALLREDLAAWLDYLPVRARRRPMWLRATRRAARNPGVRAGAVVLVCTLAAVFWWQWSVDAQVVANQDWLAALDRIGPSLINDLPATRSGNAICQSSIQREHLDRMVQLGVAPGVSRALRAMHRLDGGDLLGAAADIQYIADRGNAPFAAAAAARHREGHRELDGILTDEAPRVGGPDDCFLACIYAMRLADAAPTWIAPMLDGSGAVGERGFADLRVVRRFHEAFVLPGDEQVREFQAVLGEVARINGRRGSASGFLLHVRANALLRLGRFAEATEAAALGLQANADDYLFWLASGAAAWRSGRREQALQCLDEAIQRQPSSLRSHRLRNDVLVSLGQFARAEAALANTPWQVSGRGAYWRELQNGLLLYEKAWALRHDESAAQAPQEERLEAAPSDELFRSAREHFVEANRLVGALHSLEEVICSCLLGDDVSYAVLFQLAAAQPLDAATLEQVSYLLPATFTTAEVAALSLLFRSQSAALDGRDR